MLKLAFIEIQCPVCVGAVSVTVSTEDPVVCPQDTVTFTCTVDRGVELEWIAEPFFTDQQNQVLFLPTDVETDPTRTVTSSGVTFHAVLTHADPVPGSGGFFTLQSTLSTTASVTTNGTVIVCREGFSGASDSVTLQLHQGQLVSIAKFPALIPFPSIIRASSSPSTIWCAVQYHLPWH